MAWAQVKNEGHTLTLEIYDVIGSDFWTGGSTLKDVTNELKDFDGDTINVHINSPGGDASQGIAIYNRLTRHDAEVNVFIDGMALSAASVIAMAGDNVEMAENAMLMIHDPWLFTLGNADELRKEADTLDKWAANIARTYAKQTAIPHEEVRELMKAETWYDAEEAKDEGFVDTISDAPAIAACDSAKGILKQFHNAPKGWTRKLKKPQTVEVEAQHEEPDMAENHDSESQVTDESLAEVAEVSATITLDDVITKERLAEYVEAFGSKAAEYLAEDKTFEECREIQVAELNGTVDALREEIAELNTKLEAAKLAAGESEPLGTGGGDGDTIETGPKTFANRINLSRNGQN